MLIDINRFLLSLSKALDYVESELLGSEPYHATRVALITNRLMRASGQRSSLCDAATAAALLHDCALKEYLTDENAPGEQAACLERNMQTHCIAGEKIAQRLPFYEAVEGAILYHHERADGQGAFGRNLSQTPQCSQFIHIADMADVHAGLMTYSAQKAADLREYLEQGRGTVFGSGCVDLFFEAIDDGFLASLAGERSAGLLVDALPRHMSEISTGSLLAMSQIFADITDYKSHFTWRHSTGIAQKAFEMGRFYGLSEDECCQLCVAGLLHDIGKLCIPNAILEKPARLEPSEYRIIQNHAMGTWTLLKDIAGLEEITSWAALHHEKLDGSGYPFGYTGEKLSKNSRLMACLDIYQALTEERPYKPGMSHRKAMEILEKMVLLRSSGKRSLTK